MSKSWIELLGRGTMEAHINTDQEAAANIVTSYLTAFYLGDFAKARQFVSDDLSFRGPFVQVDSAETFFASAEMLRPLVRGHRLRRQWTAGEDVCSIFELDLETPDGAGSLLMAEWHTVRQGRIVAVRVIFDTA